MGYLPYERQRLILRPKSRDAPMPVGQLPIPNPEPRRYLKTMKFAFVVAGICAFLVGCIGPSKKEYRKANFGDYPTNFHRLVETWVEKNFDEPRGVRVSTPVRCEIPSGLLDSS